MEIIDTTSTSFSNEVPERDKPLLTSDKYDELHVMVCTPCFGGKIDQATVSGMLGTVAHSYQLGIKLEYRFLSNDSLITRARNNLVAQFLANREATHLFFLDADIQFNPNSLLRICAADRMVTAGAYPTKSMPPRYVVDFKDGATVDKEEFIEVNHAGTGFMCIKRECLELMKESYPELKYQSELLSGYSDDAEKALGKDVVEEIIKNTYSFFDTSIHDASNKYLSEDYTFCERWKKIGGKIWLDTASKIDHVGTITFAIGVDAYNEIFSSKRDNVNDTSSQSRTVEAESEPSTGPDAPEKSDVEVGVLG